VSAINGEEAAALSENQIADTRKRSLRLVENVSRSVEPADNSTEPKIFRGHTILATRRSFAATTFVTHRALHLFVEFLHRAAFSTDGHLDAWLALLFVPDW
jgi:hypothetical protein